MQNLYEKLKAFVLGIDCAGILISGKSLKSLVFLFSENFEKLLIRPTSVYLPTLNCGISGRRLN